VPDRVPISTYELVGYNSRSWENQEPSYARLMDYIRQHTDCICMWDPATNETILGTAAAVEAETRTERHSDATVTRRTMHAPGGTLFQTQTTVDGVHTVWRTERWCKSPADVDVALSVPYAPVDFDSSDLPRIRAEVANRGVLMSSVGDPLLYAAELMSLGDFTVWAMQETDHFARTIATIATRVFENLRRQVQAAPVDLYRICGPEYATPPFLPPTFFERFVQPYVMEMVQIIHGAGAGARVHCHGRIGRVLDAILATDADGLDPCEPPPDGDTTLADVKRRAGRRLCLFGNVELKLLEHGSAAKVEAAVRGCMDAAKPGGGYVIMPTAAPIDVPLAPRTEANYISFIDAALECGQY
jgi:hypothetical protein